ncbi:MAG: alpha/beta hydrolase [Leptospiraceae bacterium]|nr:alpha/beta hydrolase [Leptospiraceae bacterium]
MKPQISKGFNLFFALPEEFLYFISGKKPIHVDTNVLDSGLQITLSILNSFPQMDPISQSHSRFFLNAFSGLMEATLDYECETEDLEILVSGPVGKISIRVYKPKLIQENNLPMMLYAHGGGYINGSIDSHDRVCHLISQGAQCIVVSVGYRLAPEYKFPTAVYDVIDAYKWVWENAHELKGLREKIAIGGDSAGGTLATVTCHELKKTKYRPFFQLLMYPGCNASRKPDSVEKYGDNFLLTKRLIERIIGSYLNKKEDALSPMISPILYTDFSNLPPAYISTAGLDPISDDGFDYAEKLRSENINVIHKNFASLIHGYVNMTAIPACRKALDNAIDELRKAFYA